MSDQQTPSMQPNPLIICPRCRRACRWQPDTNVCPECLPGVIADHDRSALQLIGAMQSRLIDTRLARYAARMQPQEIGPDGPIGGVGN